MNITAADSEMKESKRHLRLLAILLANSQELTEAGIEFAMQVLKEHTPLETACIINHHQNNMLANAPKLFVEI